MPILKKTKDQIIKLLLGESVVPRGLFELGQYFRLNGPITFKYEKGKNDIVAISTNFRYGSIVTAGKDKIELEKKIKDAILTSFEIPSAYAKEAKIYKVGAKEEYALA
ncbi:hypothetical protein COT99_01900 [Candidatus Falkowbacteria bacterium CG10_big_fil_rev_8_21_14_0_10_43_10]|uniref:Uncharacterized protein n=1 Tax=Candidatus Falkowbacteria bacterium CG10_big_fil_rev_8_21_14_0_10_43_10 TaxID=1974567 RepID=A0A2H0V274_9BACT|nr:MAG: hypothetical protein COT99_01900 [Candidatus Falkowbacteria bacterium CG10_big_fil_rev_8_21_14_0_10_43_10]